MNTITTITAKNLSSDTIKMVYLFLREFPEQVAIDGLVSSATEVVITIQDDGAVPTHIAIYFRKAYGAQAVLDAIKRNSPEFKHIQTNHSSGGFSEIDCNLLLSSLGYMACKNKAAMVDLSKFYTQTSIDPLTWREAFDEIFVNKRAYTLAYRDKQPIFYNLIKFANPTIARNFFARWKELRSVDAIECGVIDDNPLTSYSCLWDNARNKLVIHQGLWTKDENGIRFQGKHEDFFTEILKAQGIADAPSGYHTLGSTTSHDMKMIAKCLAETPDWLKSLEYVKDNIEEPKTKSELVIIVGSMPCKRAYGHYMNIIAELSRLYQPKISTDIINSREAELMHFLYDPVRKRLHISTHNQSHLGTTVPITTLMRRFILDQHSDYATDIDQDFLKYIEQELNLAIQIPITSTINGLVVEKESPSIKDIADACVYATKVFTEVDYQYHEDKVLEMYLDKVFDDLPVPPRQERRMVLPED